MKLFLAVTLTLAAPLSIHAADLSDIKSVYLLPMSRGLDQYLAERLTSTGVMTIVTDPKKADAVFTDSIGGNFEENMATLFEDQTKKSDKAADSPYQRPAMQPLSRGKGNIFLVDRKSRNVLWSTFVVPKTSDSRDLSRTADEIVGKLVKAQGKKK